MISVYVFRKDPFRYMKKKRFAALLALVFLLANATACQGAAAENTDRGMQQIQELDYQGALTSFEAALVNKEDPQMIYRGQGIAYMGLTQYEEAVESFERALSYSDENPDNLDYDINYYLATAFYKQGKLDEAIAVYDAIIDMKPKEKDAWYFRGVLKLEKGEIENAKADFDQAVSIDSEDYDLRIDIFCSCVDYGQQELGQTYLEEVNVAENSANISDYDQGRIYFYLGQYEEARQALEKAKETGGAPAVSMLGQTYEQLGDYNYAASVYSNYLESNAPDADIYNQLGLCRMRTEDYQGALEAFQAGIEIAGNENLQSLKFNEIVACEYLGEFDKAAQLMEEYMVTYPDDEDAKREYEFLKTR